MSKPVLHKMFMSSNPAENDATIQAFIKDGRTLVEIRRYGSFSQRPIRNMPGIQLPAGAQQMQIEMVFYDLVVYEPNKKELEAMPKVASEQSKIVH